MANPTNSPKSVSPIPTAIRFALILTVITIILEVVKKILGWEEVLNDDPSLSFTLNTFFFAISISVVIMLLKTYRDKDLGGFMSYKKGIVVSFWMGLFYGILAASWNFVYSNFFSNVVEEMESGESHLENNPFFIMMSSLLTILFIAVIAGAVYRRDRPNSK